MLTLSQCRNNVVSIAATFCSISIPPHTLQEAQHNDPITNTIRNQVSASLKKPTDEKWRKQPLCHYVQLWSLLLLLDGILCCCYCPGPDSELITVPVLPSICTTTGCLIPSPQCTRCRPPKKKPYKDHALMHIGWVWLKMSMNTIRTVPFVNKPS